ncbi:MAG: hypothetical protein AAGI37_03860 [Planctomycetota bacterium]
MNKRKPHGFAHVILLAVLVLVALSVMARCDIDQARADEPNYPTESSDAMDSHPCRCDSDLDRPGADQPGLRRARHRA